MMMLTASLLVGIAVGCTVSWLLAPEPKHSTNDPTRQSPYEVERRTRLRDEDFVFRTFGARIETVRSMLDPAIDLRDNLLTMALRSDRSLRQYTARDFVAGKIIEGFLVGGVVLLLLILIGPLSLAVLFGLGLAVLYPLLCRQSLLAASQRRLKRQRLRLPFVIDQIALMMQAGGGFEESLRSIANEEPDHPLTEELQILLADIDAGRTRRDALLDLRERIRDEDVGELIFSIVKGEELGTPLSALLSDQADQMRIKRSQWGEKAAAEAEVQIVFPGMLVMIACLIVVLGPILLPAVMNFSN